MLYFLKIRFVPHFTTVGDIFPKYRVARIVVACMPIVVHTSGEPFYLGFCLLFGQIFLETMPHNF